MLPKIIHAALATWYVVTAAFPPSLRHRDRLSPTFNKILNLNTTCDIQNVNITVTLEQPFKGIIFAKDFSQECQAFGSLANSVELNFPTSGCGVRLISKGDKKVFYRVSIVLQQDKHLRQITDREQVVNCPLKENALVVKSEPMAEALIKGLNKGEYRTARMKNEGWSKDNIEAEKSEMEQEIVDALSAARAWMEVIPEKGTEHPDMLKVGEPALLVVKSTLPCKNPVLPFGSNPKKFTIQVPQVTLAARIGWKVVNCVAHDGLGDSSQKLLDENGCPVDEVLMPAPLLGPPRPIALMRYQEAVSKFAAFKFPDRERLHLSCSLQLCRGSCEKVSCSSFNYSTEINDNRLGRTFSAGQTGEILDQLEVFNSVEVIAPGIDLEDIRNVQKEKSSDSLGPFAHIPGDRTFCVSTDKMAITFAVLGVIFLCAVIVSVCALLRARRSSDGLPYYTRSLFSSSSSGSGFSGSKLLLHDGPCLGNTVQTSLPYGRVF